MSEWHVTGERFSKQTGLKSPAADKHPPDYRDPLCQDCVIYEEIKEELAGGLLEALDNLVMDIARYRVYPLHSNEMKQARAAIAKAREEAAPCAT